MLVGNCTWFIRLPLIHIKKGSLSDDEVVFEKATGTDKDIVALPVHGAIASFIYSIAEAFFNNQIRDSVFKWRVLLCWSVGGRYIQKSDPHRTSIKDIVDPACCRLDYMDLSFLQMKERMIPLLPDSLESLQVISNLMIYFCKLLK